MNFEILNKLSSRNRRAVVLAGGDGVRLQSFVRTLRGDALPKQYVNFFNGRSLLEATLERTRKLVPPARQDVVVTESHFDFQEVEQQLANHPNVRVTVQPANRDTGLGLLLALARLSQHQPDATVVVFPSDHFIEEEERFLTHVEAAYSFVERRPSSIVLLGIAPDSPESEYGYILPSNRWHNAFPFGAREVARFVEKPDPLLARKLILRGGFWNTMVMVFKLKTLIEYIRIINPPIHRSFEEICQAVDTADFDRVVRQVYALTPPFNLSKGFLEILAGQPGNALVVLPVRGVHWSDWGSAQRILHTVKVAQEHCFGLESSGASFNSLLKANVAGSA